MPARKPLVLDTGRVQQIQSGDALDAGEELLLADATAWPAAPSEGAALIALYRAGRRMTSQLAPEGAGYSFQPGLFEKKIGLWTALGNGTTVATWALGNSTTGTATGRNVATTNLAISLRRLAYVTGNPAGSSCGTRHGLTQFWRGNAAGLGGFFYSTRFALDTVKAGMRWFVGMSASAAVIGNVNPSTLTNIAGFGIDAGETTVRWITNDGVGPVSKTDLGASFPATTADVVYDARIFCAPNGSAIYYALERLDSAALAEGSSSTVIPANTTLLSPAIWMNNGATVGAVAVAVMSQYAETDY